MTILSRTSRLAVFVITAFLSPMSDSIAEDLSFRHDVMAVISKAGCNMGVCHGNLHGKGGLRLSLRGEDPAGDFLTLTRDQLGRRINLSSPAESLILRKPAMLQAHEGGRRFEVDSPEYRVLRDWIAAGARDDGESAAALEGLTVEPSEVVLVEPESAFQLRATAKFADGSERDVTRWAVYEPALPIMSISVDGHVERETNGETTILVRYLDQQRAVRVAFVPARPDFVFHAPTARNIVDEFVFAKLDKLRMNPSELCDDRTFARRAYLDLLGQIPTADEARRFVEDAHPDKRAILIDELLARPEFARFWSRKWCDLLRVEEKTLDRKGVANFSHWIEQSLAEGRPLDEMVREIVAAQGSTYLNPPANLYRALRDPLDRGESLAQVFLGVRLQCARCHNHPFDRWTQDDYYAWAAIFAPIDYKILENNRRDQNDKHEFDGEQIVYMRSAEKLKNPRTGKPAPPRPLGGDANCEAKGSERLVEIADWLTDEAGDRFALAQANRIWSELMGRGIVDPPDDFRVNNPPTHPELLAALARELVERDYDLRSLVRLIANSATYQLATEPNETNSDDTLNYSRVVPRRLSAEQLLDSVSGALAADLKFNGYPQGTAAGEIAGVNAIRPRDKAPSPADRFLALFGKPPRLMSCACERSTEPTLNQAFEMLSGELLQRQLASGDGLLARTTELSAQESIGELYWTILNRAPTEAEAVELARLLETAPERRGALEDIAWGLLNSSEFLLRN